MSEHGSGQAMTTGGGTQCDPVLGALDPALLGDARLEAPGTVEAGSFQTFTLIYTAGFYGVDDSGSIRVCFRYAADHSKPQLSDPKAPGYTVVTASNNARLECRFDPKANVRPFDQTLWIKVVNGYMKEGDTITVVFGARDGGSPGMRVQTFAQDRFEFRVLADPVATFNFQSLPEQPAIAIVPGPPVRLLAVLPSLRRVGDRFALGLKGEDIWGNPSDRTTGTFRLRSSRPVEGLPESVTFRPGDRALRIAGLAVAEPGELEIAVVDGDGADVAMQRMRIVARAERLPYWADLHGQSEETIGTNSAASYFGFARDLAFLDAGAHQGNDFQITGAFWAELNRLTAAMNEPGRFVTLPGYEWSGNTTLGGDRNVYFTTEGRPIRRSSHALLADRSDNGFDARTAAQLFADLAEAGEDAICFAHCGGRYADIRLAHDGRIERSIEIHSAWGTFEWLLQDALEMGYRVGIVANSDGHKGRPGASYPGVASFGAIGGLTCLLMPELSRPALVRCLRQRHHYGTTGGPNGRLHLDVQVAVEGDLCSEDPALGPCERQRVTQAMMGDIVETTASVAGIAVAVTASAGVERIDLFNGLDHLETIRGHDEAALGNRIRVLWSGASYRGRFRQVVWDGTARFDGARIVRAAPINFFNPDRVLEQTGPDGLRWLSLTTGNLAGFDAWLDDAGSGQIAIDTPLIQCQADLAGIGLEDRVWSVDGVLPRTLSIHRLPDAPLAGSTAFDRQVALRSDRDNALYVRVTLEDGTQAWSSPAYLIRPQ